MYANEFEEREKLELTKIKKLTATFTLLVCALKFPGCGGCAQPLQVYPKTCHVSEFVKVEVGKRIICRGKNGYLGPSMLSNPWWRSLLDICCVTAPKLISFIVAKSDFARYFVFHYFTDTAPQFQTTPQCT